LNNIVFHMPLIKAILFALCPRANLLQSFQYHGTGAFFTCFLKHEGVTNRIILHATSMDLHHTQSVMMVVPGKYLTHTYERVEGMDQCTLKNETCRRPCVFGCLSCPWKQT
jgi:hypothetical protein